MYESFYSLKKMPFSALSDFDSIFLGETRSGVYSQLEHAIVESNEFVVVTGKNGSGKTSLVNHFLGKVRQNVKIGFINDIFTHIDDVLKFICVKFELDVEGKNRMEMLDSFHAFLLKQYELKQRVVLVIDNAQNLSPGALEEIWMLSNLESESLQIIQVILVGQPELECVLRRKDLAKFAQRITMHLHLAGMSVVETEDYIRYRLSDAGSVKKDLFEEEAVRLIHSYSSGLPRLINIFCDTALANGFADSLQQISKDVVEAVGPDDMESKISSDTEQDEDIDLSSLPEDSFTPENSRGILSSVAEKISRLESLSENIDGKLAILVKRRGRQDETVVQLNKMLMESLKRHGNTLKQFRSFREQISRDQNPESESDMQGDEVFPFGV